jgi:hypothetical protein
VQRVEVSDANGMTLDEAEFIIAALMATAAAGMISDVTTSRAWTAREFTAVADKASKAAKLYRLPARSDCEGRRDRRARCVSDDR